jgi:hypothetical protein
VAFLAHRARAVVPIKAHRITTLRAVMATFVSQTVTQHNLLGRTDRIMEVVATATRAIQMEHVAVAFASNVCLLVQLLDGACRLLRQREIDPLVFSVDENDVAA